MFEALSLLWLAVNASLTLFRHKLGFAPLSFEAVRYESLAVGLLVLVFTFLFRKKRLAAFMASLALARLSYLALELLSSRTLLKAAPFLPFPVHPIKLSDGQVEFLPFAIGLALFWAMYMFGDLWQVGQYSGECFIKHARKLAKNSGRFALGKVKGSPLTISDEDRAKHVQIIGPTGSGKTQLILGLAYQDMLRGMPVFFMEAKGDQGDFEQFRELAKRAGRLDDVVYFNPASGKSLTFNPVAPIGPVKDTIAIANQLSRAIGREPGGTTDGEHYRSLDFSRFVDLAEVLISTGEPFTLQDIYGYFSSKDYRAQIFKKCRNKALIGPVQAALEGGGGDLSAIIAHLRPWVSGSLGELINNPNPDITIESIFSGRKLAYFAIPVGHMPLQTNALGRMLISNLLAYSQMRQTGKDRQPISIYLDEFPEFVTPVFSTLISTIRSAGLWACLSHQDLGQLKRIEGMDKDAFVANVMANTGGAKVFFKMISPEDAERIAKMLGTHKIKVRVRQFKSGFFGSIPTGISSEGEKEVFHVHPNRLRSLPPFSAVVHLGKELPVVVDTPRLYDIKESI